MSNRVGICPVCDETVDLATIYSAKDERAKRVLASHGKSLGRRFVECTGSRLDPTLTPDQRRRAEKCANELRALIDPFRIHAAFAIDCWIEQKHVNHDDVSILCDVALRHYELMRPEDVASATMRPVRIDTKYTARMWDVYCTFCGVLLYQKMSNLDYDDGLQRFHELCKQNRHAVECALKHLAFALEPAAPNVRRLPDEYLNDDTAPLLGGPTR